MIGFNRLRQIIEHFEKILPLPQAAHREFADHQYMTKNAPFIK